ncbi:MAG: hypothetical protein A3H31_01300 [Gallionellales bacterium RIFCSPLOWO2_02_FULL_57_47]|nr:MAG: hypothetical protein A3H31_01300 [Gallionellales bacterium RIFCSPLOWO2_02_FULL_57_47]OGT18314.1 MAG: hypothetical protein A3J49_03790 [Gallionellales bacterium RIFCSPHIGHO2_02_FULL_57_16]
MMQHFDTGRVRVQLTCADGRVSAVRVSSARPDVAMVLRGRIADQAVQRLPLLFALCGQAQARAAALALAAARGEEYAPRLDPEVQREVMREHLWRCLLDLPPLLGEAALQQEFVRSVKMVAEGNRAGLHALLHSPRTAALHQRLHQPEESHPVSSRLLPRLDAGRSLAEWPRLSARFCRLPDWRGMPACTGAIARRQQTDMKTTSLFSACWRARCDELMEWAAGDVPVGAGGTVSAIPVTPGIGRSLVETARGLLMHEIVLDGERIADYFIVAPTEWNFHPQGALVDELMGQEAGDRDALQQHVTRSVTALDPCVPWELEWA